MGAKAGAKSGAGSRAESEAGAKAGASMKVDQVALLAAALAAVLSTSSAEGAWEPFECVVGGVLLLIVFAFHDFTVARRNRRARAAVSGVLALLWCLALAWPVQSSWPATSRTCRDCSPGSG